jgi:predicted secreted Zn-dependent protease
MKKLIFPILFLTVAATAYADNDKVKVASGNSDISHGTDRTVVPPVVTEQYEYYEIRGNNERELRNQMCRNGCAFNDGKKYDSLTTWYVKLDYGYDRAAKACAADSVKVDVAINIRYPKWVKTDAAPPQLVAKWDNYMKNLVKHENEHRDMAVMAATELSKAVAALPPASSCTDLDREVRALSRERLEKLNADEKRLDDTTSHGKTEGAIFP